MQHSNDSEARRAKPNIVLIGIMGSGKTTVGELLARFMGFGFLDIDATIEKSQGQTIANIFAKRGEDGFRMVEKAQISALGSIRNHVISAGGGAVVDEDNWEALSKIGASVWLKTPATEIARRIVMSPDEIRNRPLIADLVNIEDRIERQTKLQERLEALEKQRLNTYGKADLTVEHAYATPETCAHFLKSQLKKLGVM
jgi:shikimate kinase